MVTTAAAELTLTELSRRSCADLTHVRYRSASDGHWCEPPAGEAVALQHMTPPAARPIAGA